MEVAEKVVKRGNQWCVIHCHGPDAGKAIKCFSTKAEADAMHRAIQARKHDEAKRHPDFERIRQMFVQQLGMDQGEDRYLQWINNLGLDETRSYLANAQMREKFQWIKQHSDFHLWKEDVDAKYWRVEAAFPIKSMNENVYTKEELLQAARTLKNKPVNLNHKFSLPTVEIVAAQYEDGVVEAVLRVPKSLKCPICDTDKTLNDLIETSGIVNVSIEASCDYGVSPQGECRGLNFTGLSLLTKQVLPGIPLTRLMPLESIMVEALQTSTKVKKVKMKIKEQDGRPPKDWWDSCISKAGSFASDPERFCGWLYHHGEEDPKFAKIKHAFGEAADLPKETLEEAKQLFEQELPDEHGQCPDGYIYNDELRKCVPDTNCPNGQHWDQDQLKCVPDTEAKPEKPETETGISPAEVLALSEEKKRRFEAEDANKTLRVQVEEWKQRWAKAESEFEKVKAANQQLEKMIEMLRNDLKAAADKRDELNYALQRKDIELEEWRKKRGIAEAELKDVNEKFEQLKREHDELTRKYHDTLKTNLELSRKLTQANEDYVQIAKERDAALEKFNKAKILGKKIIRIKA